MPDTFSKTLISTEQKSEKKCNKNSKNKFGEVIA